MTQSSTRYTDASRRLLEYARINKDDSEFSRAGHENEIVYILDTSVLESYWRRNPQSTNGRFGTDHLLTPNAAIYSGWLSLKFLIEQRLPGLKGTAFISPAHWNEALDRVDKFELDVRKDLKVSKDFKPESLDQILSDLSRIKGRPIEILQEAEKRNIGDIFKSIIQAVSSSERIKRIFIRGRDGEPGVRDLSACEYYWRLSGRTVRHQDYRRWLGAISYHREDTEEARGQRDGGSSRNNENDALTLATIEAMYRGNPEAGARRPSVRFVFVTPDATIHRAFHDVWPSLKEEGIPRFIRHPHVYAPLLNHANMSVENLEGYQLESLKRVFDGVEGAIKPLFSRDLLDNARHKETFNKSLDNNIDLWSKTVETLCLTNSHYILSDAGGEYVSAASLAKILSTPDVREAAAASVSGDIDRIRDGHVQVLSIVALDSLSHTLNSGKSRNGAPKPHRAPVKLIGVDIPAALGYAPKPQGERENWLEDLLARFRKRGSAVDIKEIIERMRAASSDPERKAASHILASCAFFAVDAWDFARMCAQLCQDQLETSHRYGTETPDDKTRRELWLREARYCEALAIRMQLHSADDVSRGKEILLENIANDSHSLAAVRDRVERSTLILTAVIVQSIDNDLNGSPETSPFDLVARGGLPREFDRALEELRKSFEEIDNFDRDDGNRTIVRIRYQAAINQVGAVIFQRLFGKHISHQRPDPRDLPTALKILDAMFQSGEMEPSVTSKIYLAVGSALEDPADKATREAIEFLTSSEVANAELSRADKREIDFFTRTLRKRLRTGRGARLDG